MVTCAGGGPAGCWVQVVRHRNERNFTTLSLGAGYPPPASIV